MTERGRVRGKSRKKHLKLGAYILFCWPMIVINVGYITTHEYVVTIISLQVLETKLNVTVIILDSASALNISTMF